MSFETYEVKVYSDGTRYWRQNGQRHRLDGPAVEFVDGTRFWRQNDQLHRLDGPAIEYSNGYKEWHQNGYRHRLDGPAVEWVSGSKGWYIKGVKYTESGFNKEIARLNSTSKTCANKIVEIDGVAYKLVAV